MCVECTTAFVVVVWVILCGPRYQSLLSYSHPSRLMHGELHRRCENEMKFTQKVLRNTCKKCRTKMDNSIASPLEIECPVIFFHPLFSLCYPNVINIEKVPSHCGACTKFYTQNMFNILCVCVGENIIKRYEILP